MKKTLMTVIIFFFSVLLTAEALLYLRDKLTLSTTAFETRKYIRQVYSIIYEEWMDTTKPQDPLSPPFLVYSNKGFDDPERLHVIFESTKLPPSKSFESYDFIQPRSKKDITTYHAHSNSLGFRGEEVSIKKAPGTYRIIVLGSYHAFGHGVEDKETYAARTEFYLNEKYGNKKRHFEVWNGGRHAGTAIVGLARLKNEILNYDPDLVIVDYGFVDTVVWGDNVMPAAMRLPDSALSKAFRKGLSPLMPILGSSRLWQLMANRYFEVANETRLTQFTRVLEEIQKTLSEHKIASLFIQQVVVAPEIFERFQSQTGVKVFSLTETFRQNPLNPPDPSEWNQGYWKKTWLPELKPSFLDQKNFRLPAYRLDLFQFNSLGHDLIARSLSEKIGQEILQPRNLSQ